MASLNFERLTAFLVEDNAFIRNTFEDILRHVGFGRVISVANGAEAIDYFKTMHVSSDHTGGITVDIVISDLVMMPINGLLLCRWIRSAKESPNRFMPFLMLSGAADRDYVNASRDIGATEFLAKPFSAEAVYKHIYEVVEFPRQFVTSHSYFGPDRRRQSQGVPPGIGAERRQTREEDITIVYSQKNIRQPKEPGPVWYFRLPNALKDKAGGLGMKGHPELPTDLLEKAEEKLQRAKLDFTQWALKYLSELSDLCTEALMKPGRRNDHFHKINLLALELRGQGGTFGYPLITMFAKMLYEISGEGCREDDAAVEIVKAHIDAMRAVIREKISGDGGALGKELLKSLKLAIAKHSTIQ